MRKSSVVGVVLVGALAALLGERVGRSVPAEARKPQTVGELVATRPAPELAGLARRSEPSVRGEDATESFWDILKLRRVGDQKAVPVLTEIMASNAGTGRIHGYAAAQALFCIGGKEAAAALDKHLFDLGAYNERLAGGYVDHWDMAEPKRSEFIGAYLLKSLGREIELAAEARAGEGGAIRFTLTVRNVSAESLAMLDPPLWRLYVRAKDGPYLVRREMGTREDYLRAKWEPLKAGQTRTATENATVKSAEAVRKDYLGLPKDVQLVLQAGGMMYDVEKPGDYEAIMVVEQTPVMGKAALPHPWAGRAVSKPVAIRLMLPARPSGE